jgi:hypothetical protein
LKKRRKRTAKNVGGVHWAISFVIEESGTFADDSVGGRGGREKQQIGISAQNEHVQPFKSGRGLNTYSSKLYCYTQLFGMAPGFTHSRAPPSVGVKRHYVSYKMKLQSRNYAQISIRDILVV